MSARHARQIDNVSENISARRMRESRNRRAKRSFVQLDPELAVGTPENDRVYTRRLNRGTLIEDASRKKRIRTFVLAAIVIAAALIIAIIVAVQVFMRTTDSKLSINDAALSQVLVAPKESEPYYMLCAADLSDPMYSYQTSQDEALMLVRIDEESKNIGFVSIPGRMSVKDPSDEEELLSTMMEDGDYSRLVGSVSLLCGVDIAHFALSGFKMLSAFVDDVGGVDVDVSQEIDDPLVGSTVIRAGENSLNGTNAMEFIRATNLSGGFSATAANRAAFTEALISKVLDSSQVELASVLSDASNYVDTDWRTSDILRCADDFKPYDSITYFSASVPCTEETTEDGSEIFVLDSDEFSEFMESIKAGEAPNSDTDGKSQSEDPKITVEVRNGAGIDGAASTLGAILENNGYTVKGVGNTNDDTLYPETLVVYTDTGSESDANTVIRDIGAGRAVEGGDFYSSKADVIVIIGTDWS